MTIELVFMVISIVCTLFTGVWAVRANSDREEAERIAAAVERRLGQSNRS